MSNTSVGTRRGIARIIVNRNTKSSLDTTCTDQPNTKCDASATTICEFYVEWWLVARHVANRVVERKAEHAHESRVRVASVGRCVDATRFQDLWACTVAHCREEPIETLLGTLHAIHEHAKLWHEWRWPGRVFAEMANASFQLPKIIESVEHSAEAEGKRERRENEFRDAFRGNPNTCSTLAFTRAIRFHHGIYCLCTAKVSHAKDETKYDVEHEDERDD